MRLPAPFAAILLALAGAALARPALAAPEGCGVCHGAERVLLDKSTHRSADIGCVTCHGGDPSVVESKALAHSAEKGFRGRITRAQIADACGTCHSDVVKMRPYGLRTDALAAWRTSHHGKAFLEKAATDAATCTDCHGVHDVLRVKDARSPAYRVNVPATCGGCHADAAKMKRHGVESTAVADFARSVHGERLARGEPGVPSCADCHDAHAATPPGALEVADVCGSCPQETRDRFRESPHFAASQRGMMQQCVTCHGNHAVSHPGYAKFDTPPATKTDDGSGVHCLTCHEKPDDPGHRAAVEFGTGLREAEAAMAKAVAEVAALQSEGFHMDDERDALDRARRELIRTVPLTHTADVHRVHGALRQARSLVEEALAGCETSTRQVRDRRIFGSAAAVLLMVASGFLILRRRRTPQ
jgi:hypothetical protein